MKPVFVVEGKSDVQRLENLFDADFVICNGSAVNLEILNYIKELTLTREVVVLTDPDYPGEQIRKKVAAYAPKVKHAFVSKEKSSNGKKLGVAECEKEEILRAVKEYVSFDLNWTENITSQDFIELGLSGGKDAEILRDMISKFFHLGHGNAKTLRKRLNMLNVSLEKLMEVTNDCKQRICR